MSRSFVSLALAAFLYGAISLTANAPATAQEAERAVAALTAADRAALQQMRRGEMAKLVVHDAPLPRIEEGFRDLYGNRVALADYAGKVVVLNLWATWCPPCRAEMPSIDRLAGELGGEDLAVIALSTDRGGVERPAKFFEEIGVEHLQVMHDRSGKVARQAGVLGLPVTLILDREGREIARLIGDADWGSPDARAVLRRVIEITRGIPGQVRA